VENKKLKLAGFSSGVKSCEEMEGRMMKAHIYMTAFIYPTSNTVSSFGTELENANSVTLMPHKMTKVKTNPKAKKDFLNSIKSLYRRPFIIFPSFYKAWWYIEFLMQKPSELRVV
jgi:hypothetical protein